MAKKLQRHHYQSRSRNISVDAIKNAGFTLVKKDGSVISVSPRGKVNQDDIQHVSLDRIRVIRAGVRKNYSSLPIDKLNMFTFRTWKQHSRFTVTRKSQALHTNLH